MGTRHLTADQRQEILDLYDDLGHTKIVQERLGYSYNQIRHTLKNAGRKLRGGKLGVCFRNRDTVTHMARGGATLEEIAVAVGTNHHRVSDFLSEFRIERPEWRRVSDGLSPMARNMAGSNNTAWRGGRSREGGGYTSLWMPDHPNANHSGRVLEHRYVMEQKLGRYLEPKEVVHHIDGNPANNAPENLGLFETNGEHLKATLTGVPCPARANRRKPTHRAPKTCGPLSQDTTPLPPE